MRMHVSTVRNVRHAIFFVMLGASSEVTAAGSPHKSQIVDGLGIYLGMLPAEMRNGFRVNKVVRD